MAFLVLQLLTGLANAMVLFLIASGLTLIFGVSRIINFAHGSFFMLAAYLAGTLAELPALGGGGFYVALVLAPVAVAVLGGALEVLLLRRIYRAPELLQLLLTFAIVLVLDDGIRWLWGPENRTGPNPPGLAGAVPILGQLFPVYELVMLAAGPLVALALGWWLYRTRAGILVRAATQDREMVGALGVNQRLLFTGVFMLGSWLAGLAGALQAPRQALSLGMGSNILAETFVVVVLGGMGNVFGALVGAVLIGLFQAFGILWLPRELQLPLVFLLMAVILILRPWGLLGRPERGPAPRAAARAPRAVPRWAAVGVAVLLLVVPPLLPTFGLWLLTEVLAFALFAASLQLLIGTGGLVSFGHAAYFGLGAYAAALATTVGGGPFPVALLLAPLLAGAVALLFGLFAVRLATIYFAMLTLAIAQIAQAVVQQWYAVTGGDNGIVGVWPPPALAAPLRYYYVTLLVAGAGIWLLGRITRSPFGWLLRAGRDDRGRAAALGVHVEAHQLLAFVLAGALAGLAGGLYAFLKGGAFPGYLGTPLSVEALVMVLLGGIHALAGAPVGAAVFRGLDTLATRYTDYWQALLGLALIVLVLVFPAGLAGWGGDDDSGSG